MLSSFLQPQKRTYLTWKLLLSKSCHKLKHQTSNTTATKMVTKKPNCVPHTARCILLVVWMHKKYSLLLPSEESPKWRHAEHSHEREKKMLSAISTLNSPYLFVVIHRPPSPLLSWPEHTITHWKEKLKTGRQVQGFTWEASKGCRLHESWNIRWDVIGRKKQFWDLKGNERRAKNLPLWCCYRTIEKNAHYSMLKAATSNWVSRCKPEFFPWRSHGR